MNDRITIEGRAGAFGAYIARPKALPAPGVVVYPEWWGTNEYPKMRARKLAQFGDGHLLRTEV